MAIGLALAVPYLVPISMLPDVVEEDQERTGRRREGVLPLRALCEDTLIFFSNFTSLGLP